MSRAYIVMVAALLAGCGAASFDENRESAFAAAVEANLDEKWLRAAEGAHLYLSQASQDDARYDRAQLLLARASEQLGLNYAASLWYLDIAQSRRNVELLDEALAGLERIVRSGVYDHPTLVEGYIATAELSGLNRPLQAFVDYYQGLGNLRRGLDGWADDRFEQISDDSPYHARARFALAVRALALGQWEDARTLLGPLTEKTKELPDDVRQEVWLAMARLSMERQQWRQAVKHYERVQSLASRRPELLLEMAWAYYYLGDSRRALGLLVALDAPAYQGLIAPERYMLEAFSLRRLCQFEPARTAASRLRVRHGEALDDLHAGVAPEASESLRQGAAQRGELRQVYRFRESLKRERELALDDVGASDGLSKRLVDLYDHGLKEVNRRFEAELSGAVAALADELVAAQDGVRLVLHELSVELLRDRARPDGPEQAPAPVLTAEDGRQTYRFIGEFWTDELDEMVVAIDDRCMP